MQHSIFSKLSCLSFTIALCVCLVAAPAQQAAADENSLVYLPVITKGGNNTTPPSSLPEQIALDRINYYRGLAGVQLVQLHPALTAAAQNHARYDLLNVNDTAAWVNGPHGEVAGKPGFSGTWPGDRALAAGYPWDAGWEVIDYRYDPIDSVDGLVGTVFHRTGILDPYHQYAGYGNGENQFEWVDVIDFGRGPTNPTGQPGVVVFPAPGQTNVPRYGSSETPRAIPPDASYPIGYPVTLQPIHGSSLVVNLAELHDQDGTLVRIHPNPDNCGTVCYALIPTSGLQPSTTYTVHVRGIVDGTPFEKTWSFTTIE